MSRLVDYFVVVGYDHEKERCGKILQRFPEEEWPETPFHQGIEMFCQPQGWRLSDTPQVPEFFVSVLTDVDAYRHYCACLTFSEAFLPASGSGDEAEDDDHPISPALMYAPKSLCLVSRHEHFEIFRQCLGIIFAIYLDKLPYKLETVVGTLLGNVCVPPAGGPQLRFNIGADDWQSLQPAQLSGIPVSRDCVASLCQELGVSHVLLLLCAVLSDCKVLFFSSSYSRLTGACHALTTICYPFKYSYVYVPVLPAPLLEVLCSPTPFIMGVHSSLKELVSDLLDVIVVDLDGCQVTLPDNMSIPLAPEPFYSHTVRALKMVLDPHLSLADHAFPSASQLASRTSIEMMDKQIRTVFMMMFCRILTGYRNCLTVVRLHPQPVITFQKAQFLGQRQLVGEEFVTKLIGCMSFSRFVHEFASPYRPSTVFDEMYSSVESVEWNTSYETKWINDMARKLYLSENPNSQQVVQKCVRPANAALVLPVGNTFPLLDAEMTEKLVHDGAGNMAANNRWSDVAEPSNVVIPLGPVGKDHLTSGSTAMVTVRRLEVLANCIQHIFENRINDAKKLLPAVIRVLASPAARLALARELSMRVQSNRAMLEHEQFDLLVKLINCALQDDSSLDEYGVAAAFLPLVTVFCRKLATGVIQFVYTKIQEHEIWSSWSFWESVFYRDVQQHIIALYWPAMLTSEEPSSDSSQVSKSLTDPSPLDIAADQLRTFAACSLAQQKELIDREESTVFSQAIHYANRMVYLRVPLDASSPASRLHRRNSLNTDNNSSNLTPSYGPGSDAGSMSEESGFQEDERGFRDTSGGVVKFVNKFVDKVCGESAVKEEHIKQLHQMIPGVVAMHIESLEAVYRESRHLQPVLKTRMMRPLLLAGEDLVIEGLRGHLLLDGREEGAGLLPCDGALFLTTYRVIFMGTPVDSYVSDRVVVRAFPVAALTKDKPLSGATLHISQTEQAAHEGLQLRSATLQLIKIGFDEEVTRDVIEHFRKFLERIRYPLLINEILNQNLNQPASLTSAKNGKKISTIKGFAKKTLLRTAKAAGLKSKNVPSKKDSKMFNPIGTPVPERRLPLSLAINEHNRAATAMPSSSRPSLDEELSDDDSGDTLGPNRKDTQTIEQALERSYIKDYRRIGFLAGHSNISKRMDEYRVCSVNLHYKLCPTYPALMVVPNSLSDDAVRSLSRHFKQSRLPAVTWQHPRNKSILLRAGAYQHTRISSVFKNSSMSTAGSMMTIPGPMTESMVSQSQTSSQADLDKWLAALMHSLPSQWTRRPSLTSALNYHHLSLVGPGNTPDSVRKNSVTPWNRAVQTLRTTSNKSSKRTSILMPSDKMGSLYSSAYGASELSATASHSNDSTSDNLSMVLGPSSIGGGGAPPNLYILADKTNFKALRSTETFRCQGISLDYPDVRRVRAAFKKMLTTLVPSAKDPPAFPRVDSRTDKITELYGGIPCYSVFRQIQCVISQASHLSYHVQVEQLDWLKIVQKLLKLGGSIVELMENQGSSVLICLEEGWDATCQLSALAQLMMDPFYRRIEGFAVLIEKEFGGFGHRFAHRNSLTTGSQNSGGVAPVFLLFLDCVSQLLRQFPLSFQFNDYYLRFLAYHSMSNRFTTFLTDCEADRVELNLDNRRYHKSLNELDVSRWPIAFGSIFDYIQLISVTSPKFFNFLYVAGQAEEDAILRPFTHTHNVVLWDYYLEESLAYGSLYDLELLNDPQTENQEQVKRRIVMAGYNSPMHVINSSLTALMQEIDQLRKDRFEADGQNWQSDWEQVDEESQLFIPLAMSAAGVQSSMVRSQSRRLQTQTTLEILDRSNKETSTTAAANLEREMGHAHRFVRQTYATPTQCNYCQQVLWGNGKMAVVCGDCGYHAHERCAENVGKTCWKVKVQMEHPAISGPVMGGATLLSGGNTLSVTAAVAGAARQSYGEGHAPDSRVMEGYLFKRGAMLKAWKLKWFVLDSMKHQLRYYESAQDREVRGVIDLAEVVGVSSCAGNTLMLPAPSSLGGGATKRFDDRACFDIRTVKRTYNLCAKDAQAAQEWMDKIQLYLQ